MAEKDCSSCGNPTEIKHLGKVNGKQICKKCRSTVRKNHREETINKSTEEEREITISEGLKKAGIAGGIIAAVVGGGKIVKEKLAKAKAEKVLLPADIIAVTPKEDITKPFGVVEKPKPVPKEKVELPSIKNTFNPEINIKFSKSKKFINLLIHSE